MSRKIAINFDPAFPSRNLAGQSFELIPTKYPIKDSAVERYKCGNTPAWVLGRHPTWCDFVAEPQCRALSVIHLTILYNWELDIFEVLDGGAYLSSLKYRDSKLRETHQPIEKPPGYGASSFGVWLNNCRLKPRNREPIYPGDRLLLDDEFRIIVSKDRYVTIHPSQWQGIWKDVEIDSSENIKQIESDLLRQVEEHHKQTKKSMSWPDVANRILNGPDDLPSRYWWIFLSVVACFVFYIWAKYLQN